jgi:dehydrogenase/reductase SDR family protein 12
MSAITLEQSLSVERPLSFVFRYVSDFSHLASWAPSILQSVQTTPGEIRAGTHFDILMQIGRSHFRIDYLVTQLNRPHFVEVKGKGESFSIIERIRLEGDDATTHLQYQIEIYYQETAARSAKVLSPLLNLSRRKDLAYLQKALNQDPSLWYPSLWTRLADRMIIPGMLNFSRNGYARHKTRFIGVTEDLKDKTLLITGPTSGIGAAAARQLAKLGANLIFVSRNRKRAELMAESFEREGLKRPQIETADMSVIADIEELAARLLASGAPLDGLINNAGSLFNERKATSEGIEMTFATLLLGPYVLTERLYPLLQKADRARVINVSSGGMYTQALALDDLESEKDYQGDIAYARAKRGLVDLSEVWAERWEREGITVHAMHPGWTDTPGVSHSMPKFYEWTKSWLRTPDQAADTIVWLVAAKEAAATTGRFWLDRTLHDTGLIPGTKSHPRHQQKLVEMLQAYHERLTTPRGQGFSEIPSDAQPQETSA